MATPTRMLLFSFALALAFGLMVGSAFLNQGVSFVEDSASVTNAGFLFLYILFATAVLLVVLRFYKGSNLFLAAELLLLFSSFQLLLSLVLPEDLGFVLAACAVALRLKFPQLKMPLLLAASVIVGALLGSSLDLIPAALLSFMLAGYDYFAVFRSKHMVTLAKELGNRNAAFAIEFKTPKKTLKANEKIVKVKGEPKLDSILLGTGDFVIPIMLCVSVLKTGVLPAIATALGAVVGLSILMYLLEKKRGYYPALPPIVLFSALSYSLSLLFSTL